MATNFSESFPSIPGAYALIIDIPKAFRPSIPTLAGAVLQPGRYLYAGSANGPGGMGARIRRHMRKQKPRHWHIDRLTNAFGVAKALAFDKGVSECALIEKALKWPGTETPLKGFGSSDCGKCPAHLVKLPYDFNLEALY